VSVVLVLSVLLVAKEVNVQCVAKEVSVVLVQLRRMEQR
jgi:hypothetical protein